MSWNFALILFVLLVVTGVIWTLDVLVWRKARRQRAQEAVERVRAAGIEDPEAAERMRQEAVASATRVPWWIEYGVSFFPVILFVFVLRSFVVEPFRIPSGSMLPTLQSGDLILVNKFSYGIRLPVIDKKVIPTGAPERGDVMVFRYPVDPDIDYIKRVVGLPGDEVAYLDKKLYINGELVPHQRDGDYFEPDRVSYTAQYKEKLGKIEHKILLDENKYQEIGPIWKFPDFNNCQYVRNGVRCKVPEGQYFVMGDNRDNSADSRYWGFVPDSNVVGKAFFIWMNFGDLSRIGRFH
ncbi:signal peptidase I [Bordetella trematum]|uniref:Signal peptidase I n=1 Tax=Bordetella trematum TaxID=123899 RepID=A0A157SM85_9BORD|nr:signal peptidase I [Bordetella trematum]AUL46691.1 S26 family signal peptidase [Bordetella trematum]AZR93484.1 signal peptidase I [Bordetella trematum]NNH20368.1 signal peptidase I [Bordetella trematum]QIM72070.1 signal peptidase I [Bordetella trematum]SAI15512.1 signal peptidase I [Bordetella trematum]